MSRRGVFAPELRRAARQRRRRRPTRHPHPRRAERAADGASAARRAAIPFVPTFFDFSIYIDADTDVLRTWYVDRFFSLRETAFKNPKSYFHRYAALSDDEARETATRIWETINL